MKKVEFGKQGIHQPAFQIIEGKFTFYASSLFLQMTA